MELLDLIVEVEKVAGLVAVIGDRSELRREVDSRVVLAMVRVDTFELIGKDEGEEGDGVISVWDDSVHLVKKPLAVNVADTGAKDFLVLEPPEAIDVVSANDDEVLVFCEDDDIRILDSSLSGALGADIGDVEAVSVGPRAVVGECAKSDEAEGPGIKALNDAEACGDGRVEALSMVDVGVADSG